MKLIVATKKRQLTLITLILVSLSTCGNETPTTNDNPSLASIEMAPSTFETQAEEGSNLFATNCAACHGANLEGTTLGPLLSGRSFVQRWGTQTPALLLGNIQANMPPGGNDNLSQSDYLSIVAHILRTSNQDGVCFIGGISSNYNSNFLLGKGVLSVMEADEYDRSFLKLSPHSIVLTSMDADHLDIYNDKETLQSSFYNFTELLENKKKLIVEEGLKNLFKNNLTYGFNSESNLQILNIKILDSCYQFDIKYRNKIYNNFSFKMPGKYNLLNAAGAVLSCLENEINMDDIRSALHSYKGVKRRFDIHVENSEIVYIDDYAHHPSEISALLNAVKEFYPNKKTIGLFQPHLYSRTRDFLQDFSSSLSSLDELFLLPIYPAREKPIEGINSSLLLSKVPLLKKQIISSENDLFSQLDSKNSFVLLTIGAGDIDEWVPSIIDYINKR